MNDSVSYLTKEGLAKIQEELRYLKEERRPELAELLQKAIAEGDLKENANYHDAKEQQSLLEGRILDLDNSLRNVQIIEEETRTDRVRVGATVTICEVGFEDEEEVYRIVGKHEADPLEGRISNESPIGRALLGAKKGQTVQAETPRGILELKVLKIA